MTTTSEFALSAIAQVPTPTTRAADPRSARLEDIESDTRRLGVGDIDDDDIGELSLRDRACSRCPDIASATNDCDLSIHDLPSDWITRLLLAAQPARSFAA